MLPTRWVILHVDLADLSLLKHNYLYKSLRQGGEVALQHLVTVGVYIADGDDECAPVDLAGVVVEEEVKDDGGGPCCCPSILGQIEGELGRGNISLWALTIFSLCTAEKVGHRLRGLSIFNDCELTQPRTNATG